MDEQVMDVHYRLPGAVLSSCKYSYVCEGQQGFQMITRHHVIVRRNKMLEFLLRCAVFGLMACICALPSSTVAQGASFIGMCILSILVAAVIHINGIQQESVVVMPTLGVQLETCYRRREDSSKSSCNKLNTYTEVKSKNNSLECEYSQPNSHGKVFRRFVPMGNILAAVINEAVTPFTCYWYLAFIVREERKLALVFQELQPPLDMLVPIWKSLCSAIANKTPRQSNNGD